MGKSRLFKSDINTVYGLSYEEKIMKELEEKKYHWYNIIKKSLDKKEAKRAIEKRKADMEEYYGEAPSPRSK